MSPTFLENVLTWIHVVCLLSRTSLFKVGIPLGLEEEESPYMGIFYVLLMIVIVIFFFHVDYVFCMEWHYHIIIFLASLLVT